MQEGFAAPGLGAWPSGCVAILGAWPSRVRGHPGNAVPTVWVKAPIILVFP